MTAALLTPDEMGQADRLTIESGLPGLDLMERAGSAVAGMAANHAPAGGRIHILCGPGNNGGDGFVAARLLAEKGYDVRVDLLKSPSGLKGDAAAAFAAMTLPFEILTSGDQLIGHMADRFIGADVIIDALFGAGLDRPLSGPAAELVEAVNGSSAAIIAVDLPSGINGATGEIMGSAIKAHATVTFFLKKPGHLLFPGRGLCGSITVAQIGIETDVLDKIGPAAFENTPDFWLASWPRPAVDGHKYSKGHAVVFSGPMASTGAARLAAMAALRTGAGLVTLASPPDAMMVNASHLTAVMLKKVSGPDAIPEFLSDPRLNAVLIGPGYGIGEDTQAAVEAIIATGRSLVLDADALTSFSKKPQKLFDLIKENASSAILTPHDGEFQRLFPDLTGLDKLTRARDGGTALRCNTHFKRPRHSHCSTGRPGRDQLQCAAVSGNRRVPVMCWQASRLACWRKGVPAFEAACQAVWLHGEAGRTVGPGLIAEDLAAALREPLRHLWTSLA